jgi:hypothetical protein
MILFFNAAAAFRNIVYFRKRFRRAYKVNKKGRGE